ncbi:hypothetical protein K449DRAFT_72372 [Hypoxylon sp. EC38]|nr:hypothetical protein K449DRAFT_72372 [Hypoxylon sp. EC38]
MVVFPYRIVEMQEHTPYVSNHMSVDARQHGSNTTLHRLCIHGNKGGVSTKLIGRDHLANRTISTSTPLLGINNFLSLIG